MLIRIGAEPDAIVRLDSSGLENSFRQTVGFFIELAVGELDVSRNQGNRIRVGLERLLPDPEQGLVPGSGNRGRVAPAVEEFGFGIIHHPQLAKRGGRIGEDVLKKVPVVFGPTFDRFGVEKAGSIVEADAENVVFADQIGIEVEHPGALVLVDGADPQLFQVQDALIRVLVGEHHIEPRVAVRRNRPSKVADQFSIGVILMIVGVECPFLDLCQKCGERKITGGGNAQRERVDEHADHGLVFSGAAAADRQSDHKILRVGEAVE
ncbi:MAG: hypothetical protein BWY82_00330 [Verrucomicrobia bacterium ADurb.Bin474]|nr:MAG: hypothetical protein BWY82_00330 [Verrucomicrobia bacterium ADurb.Bin474]